MFNCEKFWQNLRISRSKLNQTFLNVLKNAGVYFSDPPCKNGIARFTTVP